MIQSIGAAFLALLFLSCPPVADGSSTANQTATITVDAGKPGIAISPTLWGIFFEEINCGGDGGIYAELVRNRSFEDSERPEHWSLAPGGAKVAIESRSDAGELNRRSLQLTLSNDQARLVNEGYWGIAIRNGESYVLQFQAKASGLKGPLTVALEGKDGTVYAKQLFNKLGANWAVHNGTLKPNKTDPAARLVLSAAGPGTVWLDMVSLFPKRTWNGRTNGMRADLAGKLNELKPGFMRFPGGCWVEGDTMKLAYRWKQTIGDLSQRRTQFNIWQYNSTHGLGYHEYLQLSEDLGAEPLFVINCGMSHREVVPMDQMGPYVQDALDAIEYANGPATSTWGSARARNGHPAPFGLKYMEIGNENGGPAYRERYLAFYKAIKNKYPQMNLIANDWGGVPKDAPLEIIDEHYYNNPTFFIQNANKYDAYPRTGPKVYVGEYAVTANCGQGNLAGAIGEAAFMTGMERNSDVVVMASYAPLFANVHYKRWNPDLINFDSSRVYGTPSFYVQKLFARNTGNRVIPTVITAAELRQEPARGGIGLGTWETQAEYKDIKVVQDGRTLYAWDAEKGTNGWRNFGGAWAAIEGALRQSNQGTDRRLLTGDPAWSDYTLTLKARKVSGAEGFLILFHAHDAQNWLWWNIGGWGNSRHAIEKCSDGAKVTLEGGVNGRVEAGRWYDVRVEVKGDEIRCYLDDKLVHQVRDSFSIKPLHAVASRDEKTGDLILKVVNVAPEAFDTQLRIDGVRKVRSTATATVLGGTSPSAENTLDQPLRVAPTTQRVQNAAPEFRHTFPAQSLTVLRLSAK